MTKEQLLALGLDDANATKVAAASADELKTYVQKTTYDEIDAAKKTLENQVKEHAKQLETLKKSTGDAEALKQEITTLQEANKTAKTEYEAKVKQMQIASAVGMIQRTWNFSDAGVTADTDGYKTIKAGTIYPANDATAKGVVFENVDVTDGAHAGSLIIAGRLYSNRLPVIPNQTAVTPLVAQGIYFDVADETIRED